MRDSGEREMTHVLGSPVRSPRGLWYAACDRASNFTGDATLLMEVPAASPAPDMCQATPGSSEFRVESAVDFDYVLDVDDTEMMELLQDVIFMPLYWGCEPPQSLHELSDAFSDRIWSICWRITGNYFDARDALLLTLVAITPRLLQIPALPWIESDGYFYPATDMDPDPISAELAGPLGGPGHVLDIVGGDLSARFGFEVAGSVALAIVRRRPDQPRERSYDWPDRCEDWVERRDAIDYVARRDEVQEILAGLAATDRAALALREYGGFHNHQIASALAIEPSTVKGCLQRGRAAFTRRDLDGVDVTSR